MITGPEGLPEQCQLAFTWMPVLAQGQCGTKQWLKAAVSDSVDLCPCLFTPRACHAPEPRGSNKALCPLCTCSTSWSFQGLSKLHVPSRAGLQHASIHTLWFLLQSTSVHVLLWYVFWFATKVGKHHTFEITTVTSFCKYVLHQQKKFLNHPAECIAHAFIYRYVQHQWAEKSILFSISLLVTKFPSWNWPLLLHSCNTDHL